MMNDKLRAAAQAALETLDILSKLGNGDVDGDSKGNEIAQDARQNLRAALAEPEEKLLSVHRLDQWLKAALAEPAIKESLTVAEQEPVGKFSKFSDGVWKEVTTSSPGQFLYTAPPRKEWVGLTDEEIDEIGRMVIGFNSLSGWENEFGLAIETKLRERNGG